MVAGGVAFSPSRSGGRASTVEEANRRVREHGVAGGVENAVAVEGDDVLPLRRVGPHAAGGLRTTYVTALLLFETLMTRKGRRSVGDRDIVRPVRAGIERASDV